MNNIKELFGGKIIVISPEADNNFVPLFCRVCKFPMKTLEDSVSYRKVRCCNHCDMRWGSSKQGRLEDGWTPEKTTEDWQEYIKDRIIYFKHLINLK